MKNRFFGLILIICMLLSMGTIPVCAEDNVWDGSIASGFESGSGTQDDPYVVATAPQLAYLAKSVNSGTSYSGKYIKLANNIVLNTPDMFAYDENCIITGAADGKTPYEWTAIGNESNKFCGVFNGDNHEIKGIYINKPDENYQGLFGRCDKAAIAVVDVTDGFIRGRNDVGGITGYIYASDGKSAGVAGCLNTCTIVGNSSVGGIVGENSIWLTSSYIAYCYNYGAVTANSYAGGIVGYNESEVTYCSNAGTVTGSGKIGGIAGENCGYVGYPVIAECYNCGTVNSNGSGVGGITGCNRTTVKITGGSSNDRATVLNCFNTGDVTGNDGVGGIAGLFTRENDAGNVSVKTCYNVGKVTGTNKVGGVVGSTGVYSQQNTISNCYYHIGCAKDGKGIVQNGEGAENLGNRADDVRGSMKVLTYEQMKNQSSFGGFDFNNVWTMEGNADYSFPELAEIIFTGEYTETEEYDGSIPEQIEQFSGSGTKNDPYIITNASQLAYLAETVNDGYNFAGKYIKLANDIVLNALDMFAYDKNGNITGAADGKTPYEWTAIGNYDKRFSGIFDGDNHEIKGIYIDKPNSDYQGLFGFCDNATVENVGVTNGYIKGAWEVGGIAGRNSGSVKSCYNSCTIEGSGAGGVVGWNIAERDIHSEVTECYNTGKVIGYVGCIGGVVGFNAASGVEALVNKCYNTGDVEFGGSYTENINLGGVVGTNEAYDNGGSWVQFCYNTGNIKSIDCVGGVVGDQYADNSSYTSVVYCYNIGQLNGGRYVGGVAGNSPVSPHADISYDADVEGSGTIELSGGYEGGSTVVENCYYLSGCAIDKQGTVQFGIGTDTAGEALPDTIGVTKGLTDEEMQQKSSFGVFHFGYAWTMEGNPQYPYPELIGMDHYSYVLPHTETQVVKNGNYYNVSVKKTDLGTATIIIAGYKDNRLLDLEILNNDDLQTIFTGDFDKFKVMTWESLSNLKPLCEPETITKNEWSAE